MVLAVLPELQYSNEPHASPVTPALFLTNTLSAATPNFFPPIGKNRPSPHIGSAALASDSTG